MTFITMNGKITGLNPYLQYLNVTWGVNEKIVLFQKHADVQYIVLRSQTLQRDRSQICMVIAN